MSFTIEALLGIRSKEESEGVSTQGIEYQDEGSTGSLNDEENNDMIQGIDQFLFKSCICMFVFSVFQQTCDGTPRVLVYQLFANNKLYKETSPFCKRGWNWLE